MSNTRYASYAIVFRIFAFEVQLNACSELLMQKYEKV